MPKLKTLYACSHCHKQFSKWAGQCEGCGMWNTLLEQEAVEVSAANPVMEAKQRIQGESKDTFQVADLLGKNLEDTPRMHTKIEEVDRVFGGGITHGSVCLLSGEPGIGKSTLAMQVAATLSHQYKVLYVSGEESMQQIASRAKRLHVAKDGFSILHEIMVEHVVATMLQNKTEIVVLDSIQMLLSSALSGVAGSVGQIRFCTELLVETAKRYGITMIIIGHVTKDGSIAGPKTLEHLVDTVLLLEGEKHMDVRMLRAEKNRFGPTDELGVFRMLEGGLEEVADPSRVFLEGRRKGSPGSALTAVTEGSRVFLFEVQALTTYTKFGYPKRTAVGMPLQRVQLLLAVINRFSTYTCDNHDVYVNIVGGVFLKDPSSSLAVLLSVLSSRLNIPLPEHTLFLGEVGLTGEIRAGSDLAKKVKEAAKRGVKEVVIPRQLELEGVDIKLRVATTVEAVISYCFSKEGATRKG